MNSFELIIGPEFLGMFFCTLFYGMLVIQTVTYLRTCKKDPVWIKSMVFVLFVANTLLIVIFGRRMFAICVTFFGNLLGKNEAVKTGAAIPALISITAGIVQIFFGYRVLRLGHNRWLFVIIVVMALVQTFGGIGITIHVATLKDVFTELQKLRIEITVCLVAAAAVDITITASLVYYLRKHRTGFSRTDDVISKVIIATVQTGFITAIWATVNLMTYLFVPNNLHMLFHPCLGVMYTNALLSSLNSRGRLSALQYTSGPIPEGGANVTELSPTPHRMDG
jgi:hypothetical protein